MRFCRVWGLAVALAVAMGAPASIIVGGQWGDWLGSYNGTSYSNWRQNTAASYLQSPDYRYANDPDGDANGGQDFDIEQLYYFYDDFDSSSFSGGTLYVGIVTGYEDTNSSYDSGDFFIDLGADGDYDLAIGTDSGSSRYGDAWINENWTTRGATLDSDADPYRVRRSQGGYIEYGTGSASGLTTQIAWGYGVGAGSRHNFLEFCLDIGAGYEHELTTGIGFHWTMECGNDYINHMDQ